MNGQKREVSTANSNREHSMVVDSAPSAYKNNRDRCRRGISGRDTNIAGTLDSKTENRDGREAPQASLRAESNMLQASLQELEQL